MRLTDNAGDYHRSLYSHRLSMISRQVYREDFVHTTLFNKHNGREREREREKKGFRIVSLMDRRMKELHRNNVIGAHMYLSSETCRYKRDRYCIEKGDRCIFFQVWMSMS